MFTRGLGPTLVRAFPTNAAIFCGYEFIKRLLPYPCPRFVAFFLFSGNFFQKLKESYIFTLTESFDMNSRNLLRNRGAICPCFFFFF